MQQFQTRWSDFWHRLGAGNSVPAIDPLLQSYTKPPRAYHNIRHIQQCLAELDTVRAACEAPDEIELALWYHDVVYDATKHDNEERSADQAADAMRNAGLDERAISNVISLILATKHAAPPVPGDAQLIVDIDLSILGRPAAEFDAYENAIRREYSFVDEASFRAGRSAILKKFLARDVIFSAVPMRQKYEAAARENLRRSIARLSDPTT